MAILNLHWEAVAPAAQGAPNLRAVLAAIHETDHAAAERFMPHFYLAGGTALALQLGHRRSIDLDFSRRQMSFRSHPPGDHSALGRLWFGV